VTDGHEPEAIRAWAAAVASWMPKGDAGLPESLRPQAFGLVRPGGSVRQLPWGEVAAQAISGKPLALAPYLEHTLLQPDALLSEVRQLGKEASAHGFGAACVSALHLPTLLPALAGSEVLPVAVVGFPHGAHRSEVKALEARLAVDDGARELDVVAALGALRAMDVRRALEDIRAVVEAVRPWPVKLILETGLLDRRAVVLGAGLALVAGCGAVKTSTGFSGQGARVEDVALLRAVVGQALMVKASGGIRTRGQALALVAAGASRLGTSASVSLVA
jgi:deoxyribose-phosphate aldolase